MNENNITELVEPDQPDFQQNRWTLKFKGDMEAVYQADYLHTTVQRTRIGILLGVIFYSLFYILDILYIPDQLDTLFVIRFGVVGPYILLLFILSYTKIYERLHQQLNAIGILFAGGGITLMTLLSPVTTKYYYAGIILVLIYATILMGLRFPWAIGSTWVVVTTYILGTEVFTDLPLEEVITNYFFLVGSNLLLLFGGFFFEKLSRNNFIQRYQLSQSQIKIEGANVELESMVTARTAALIDEVAERKLAQREMQKALQEKEALLKEVYHRTKNNMNVIISLLNLQAYEETEKPAAETFKQLSDRIHAMSLVHEQLYGSANLSTIRLDKYVDNLATQRKYSLLRSPSQVNVEIQGDPIEMGLEQAVPLGLALNEIISNAILHGFQDGREGTLTVKLAHDPEGALVITIENDGRPMEKEVDISKAETLGFRLLQILVVEQLQGRIEQNTAGNVSFTIIIPEI